MNRCLHLLILCALSASACGSSTPDHSPPPDASPYASPDLALSPPSSFGRGFTDLTALSRIPEFVYAPTGARDEPEATTGHFADLDGDGRPELILSEVFGESAPAVYRYDLALGLLVPALDLVLPFRPIGAIDLDGDGVIDLLGSLPQTEVAWGKAGGGFEAPVPLSPEVNYLVDLTTMNFGFSLDDIDRDGRLDVVAGTRLGCSKSNDVRPKLRGAGRRFVDRADLVAEAGPSAPYSVLAGIVGKDTRVLLGMGNGCGYRQSSLFYRLDTIDALGLPRFLPWTPLSPSSPFSLITDGTGALRPLTGWSPMGAAIGDLDGDGLFDVVVGFDTRHGTFLAREPGPFIDATDLTGFGDVPSDNGASMLAWGLAIVDVDRDGRADVIAAHGNDQSAWQGTRTRIGPAWATVHWNGGGGRFADVSRLAGIDRRGQWRALATGDLDGDGDVDLIVGGQGELPRVWRNDIDTGNHGFSLRLRGTSSNHLGVGARVDVLPEGGTVEQHLIAGGSASPYALSEPLVFAGLRSATKARVRITWPSGTVQELASVEAGRLHILDEPPLYSIDPASRRLPASPDSMARILVTPRAPDGTLRLSAKVEVAVANGPGTLSITSGANGWTATLLGTMQSGTTVIEIRVDGVASPIHPRIDWE